MKYLSSHTILVVICSLIAFSFPNAKQLDPITNRNLREIQDRPRTAQSAIGHTVRFDDLNS